jgi:Xaa-Pro aminopeptidase
MMKMERGLTTWFDWIKVNLQKDSRIGVDMSQVGAANFKLRFDFFKDLGMTFTSSVNLVDLVWGEHRPVRPKENVWVYEEKYTGHSTQDKYTDIFKKLKPDCHMLLVSSLDDIAWTLNMRGNDIEYNPLFFSFLILVREGDNIRADLFIDKDKCSDPKVMEYLAKIRVTLHDYDKVHSVLEAARDVRGGDLNIAICKDDLNAQLFLSIEELKLKL